MTPSGIEIVLTPVFWIVSAFGSLALSVLGNLLTPTASRILEQYSEKKRRKVRKVRAAKLVEASTLTHPEQVTQKKLKALYILLLACALTLLGLTCFSMGLLLTLAIPILYLPFIVLGLPLVAGGIALISKGMDVMDLAEIAEKRNQVIESPEGDQPSLDEWERQQFGMTMSEAVEAQTRIS